MSDEEHSLEKVEDILDLLQKECELWQKKLRLQDWNIEVKLCRIHQMPQQALAHIEFFVERKDAFLTLLAPCDLPLIEDNFLGNEAANYDISIVHELLHLHFIGLGDPDNEVHTMLEEQAVNTLSRAFVTAHAGTIKSLVPPTKLDDAGHYL